MSKANRGQSVPVVVTNKADFLECGVYFQVSGLYFQISGLSNPRLLEQGDPWPPSSYHSSGQLFAG